MINFHQLDTLYNKVRPRKFCYGQHCELFLNVLFYPVNSLYIHPGQANWDHSHDLDNLGDHDPEGLVGTVLCKSNASEMRELRSLFKRTFQESLRESSSDNSRPFERNFPRTKNAFSSTFPYEMKFHNQKRRFTNSVPEISRWRDTTIPCTIYSIYPSYNVRERYTEGFKRIPELEFSHEQKE